MKNSFMFFTLCAYFLTITWACNTLIVYDDLYFSSYANVLTDNQIQELVANSHGYSWLAYVALPLILFIKICFTVLAIASGLFFINKNVKINTLFRIAIKAEIIFLIPIIIKIIWFTLYQREYTLIDLQSFYPLSILSIIDYKSVDEWARYPLQLLNLFEMCYWLYLAYNIKNMMGFNFGKSLGLVAVSYGSALTIWIIFFIFLTVELT